jgi:hypothetical protein
MGTSAWLAEVSALAAVSGGAANGGMRDGARSGMRVGWLPLATARASITVAAFARSAASCPHAGHDASLALSS